MIAPGFVKRPFRRNAGFVKGLGNDAAMALLVLLLLQVSVYLYFLLTLPVHFDEWHSWRFFSGVSFYDTFTFYPAPNNHVFYNLVSRIFVVTGINADVAFRLPSLLSSILASYYFFKLCKNYFSSFISIMLLAYVVGYNYFILYSCTGRGYSFVNLFCILTMYSAMKLSLNYTGRYRILFIVSQFLGVFTVPSFLYVIFPIAVVTGVYVLRMRSLKKVLLFSTDYLFVVLLILAGYSGILLTDPSALFSLQTWTDKFSIHDPEWFNALMFYLDEKFNELFGTYRLKTCIALFIFSVIYYFMREKRRNYFLGVLSGAMFISPLFIVILHGVYPFGRTWFYLLFPSAVSFGFIIYTFLSPLSFVFTEHRFRNVVRLLYVFMLGGVIGMFCLFPAWHRQYVQWDYGLSWLYRNTLKPAMAGFKEVSRTSVGIEFYPADVISHLCKYNEPAQMPAFTILGSIHGQDLLIIHGDKIDSTRSHLGGYQFIYLNENVYFYMKDELYRQKVRPFRAKD